MVRPIVNGPANRGLLREPLNQSKVRVVTMDRVAVFVDAGYLFAQGSKELSGTKLTRSECELDHSAVRSALRDYAEAAASLPLLRIYWYDGTSQGPTPQHIALANQPDVKVRLGFVNSQGQQKGVDSLIVTDMITLARNRAMGACVLLSGDEDLRVGVQQAQEYGIRVHLLGIRPSRGSQSSFLREEADRVDEWTSAELSAFLACAPHQPANADVSVETDRPRTTTQARVERSDDVIDVSARLARVAQEVADSLPVAEAFALADQIRSTGWRPPEVDGRLLAMSRSEIGHDLDPEQKNLVRTALVAALAKRSEEVPD